jgi:hypothetical protein
MNLTSEKLPPSPNQGIPFVALNSNINKPWGLYRLVRFHIDPNTKKPWWEDYSIGETLAPNDIPEYWSECPTP